MWWTRSGLVVALLIVLIAAASCTGPGPPRKSAMSDVSTRVLEHGGERRSYDLYLPPETDVQNERPLILLFHGGGGTPEAVARSTGLPAAAVRAGYVVAVPRGIARTWNAGDCCGLAHQRGVDDVAFANAVVADVGTVVAVRGSAVLATGFSNGGKMAYRLGCDRADRFAAIAPVSAGLSVPPDACRPSRSVPLLAFHGTEDPFAPYSGGRGSIEAAGVQRSAPESVSVWAALNGCTSEAKTSSGPVSVTRTIYVGCPSGATVTLVTIDGMGHHWPGGRPTLPSSAAAEFGPTSNAVSATEEILRFFDSHIG